LPSFAKAKEKQRHPQANASCSTFAFAQPQKDLLLNSFKISTIKNEKK